MRTVLAFVGIIFFTNTTWGSELSAYGLYEDKFLIPRVLIPFHVSGSLPSDKLIGKVLSSSAGDCRVMQDPFINSNFLMKCTEEGVVSLQFTVIRDSKFYILNYGPFELKNKTGVIIPDPIGDVTEPLRAMGKGVYKARCLECHKSEELGKLKGKSKAQIVNSFNTTSDMLEYDFENVVSASELDALERFFKDITANEMRGN